MKKALWILISLSTLYSADINETNSSSKKEQLIKKNILQQIKKEEKYAKEQKFYQGNEYNLSSAEINPDSLSSIEAIEPDYDFNMDDVYSDEQ